MLRLLSIFLLAFAASAQSGWKNIFPDGKLTGWTRLSIPPGKPLSEPSQWKVDKAAKTLVCDGTGGHDMLRYDTPFEDFVLHVEWKYTQAADPNARYNSGVFVRNDAEGKVWHQAQTGQTGAFLFGNSLVDGQPKRFNYKDKITQNTIKPVGEWNTFEITAKGKTISLNANGTVVSEFTGCEVPKGYIALEGEGYRIEFRNIRIKPL